MYAITYWRTHHCKKSTRELGLEKYWMYWIPVVYSIVYNMSVCIYLSIKRRCHMKTDGRASVIIAWFSKTDTSLVSFVKSKSKSLLTRMPYGIYGHICNSLYFYHVVVYRMSYKLFIVTTKNLDRHCQSIRKYWRYMNTDYILNRNFFLSIDSVTYYSPQNIRLY